MNAQEWQQLLSAYYDGAATPEEAAAAEKLLAERADCRVYLEDLRKISSSLRLLKEENLSPDADMKILKNVKKESKMPSINLKTASLVLVSSVAVVLVLQQYIQRGIQGRMKSSADDIGDQFSPQRALQARARDASVYLAEGEDLGEKINANQRKARGIEISFLNQPSSDAVLGNMNKRMATGIITAHESSQMAVNVDKSIIYPAVPFLVPAAGNTEEYAKISDNAFLTATDNPLSTFSIDVDTASYSNVRRFLVQNQMPPKDAVRIEEMVNYFTYNYPVPEGNDPFSITTNMAVCPWNTAHQLLQIGLKGRTPDVAKLPPSNLVFLIDVSGSMNQPDKLPLLKEGFKMMVNQLRAEDKASIVVYAGNAGKVLEPTPGDHKEEIIAAIDAMQAGGSTAGGQGIRLAYELAKSNFIKGGNNRVILATDGDFNVGVSSTSELVRLVEEKRKDGIFLTILGFGQGNVKDSRMEQLADNGNGNYYYIDNIKEARKVMVNELGSMLFTIAKDVKIQIEFNPAAVKAYRLVGYENRMLAKEDFNNDQKDAGDIGAGHTVTALYEIVPSGSGEQISDVDALKYQKSQTVTSDEVMTVKLRYKEPDGDKSQLLSRTIQKAHIKQEPAGDFAWASSVAEFGMLLRRSDHRGDASYGHVLKTAKANTGEDKFGLRAEFITLVEAAQNIAPSQGGQLQFKH